MKKFQTTDLKPCPHMRTLVSAHVDGQLGGVAEWYTKAHIKGCKQCQASLPFLDALKDRLEGLDEGAETCELAPERLVKVESELLKVDSVTSTS
jgi:hypothetical protein